MVVEARKGETVISYDYTTSVPGPLGDTVYVVRIYLPDNDRQLPKGDIRSDLSGYPIEPLSQEDVLYFCREARTYLRDMKTMRAKLLAIIFGVAAIVGLLLFYFVTPASFGTASF